jgi:hypothetical protein
MNIVIELQLKCKRITLNCNQITPNNVTELQLILTELHITMHYN